MLEFMNCKHSMAGALFLFSCTIIFLWKSSFLFVTKTESRLESPERRRLQNLSAESGLLSHIDVAYVNVKFL